MPTPVTPKKVLYSNARNIYVEKIMTTNKG
jgi:hypothetical protein